MAEQSSDKQLLDPLKIHQLFRFSTAADKTLIIFGTLAAIVAASGLPVAIVLFGELADSFVYFSIAKQHKVSNRSYAEYYDTNEFMNDVRKFGIGSIIIGIIQLVFCYLMMIAISFSAKRQVSRIKLLYFKSILRQDMAWFDTYHEDLIVQAGQSLSKMKDAIGQKAALLLFFIFECFLSLITALYYGWKLTLVILSLVPILLMFSYFFNKIQLRFASRETAAYSKAAILAEEALSSIRTVVAYGGENTMIAWYNERLKFARLAGINKGLINAVSQAFVWAFEYSSYSLAFWYGVELIIESNKNQTYEYEPGTLLIVYFCTIMGTIAINQALPYWDGINSAKVYMGPVYSIIERESLVDSLSTAGIKPTEFKGSIELRNVSFRYPARPEVQILNKVSLKFPPGEKVALVGSSGCGKSTIMHLIERFYDPDEGEVLIDGYNLRELNLQWVRKHIGCVTQEPVLFATSIKENIDLGKGVSDDAIMEAIELANASDFVLKLPQKQSTVVGERGSFLSGGQKQKIALARAFITQPKVLLLDEATSALDGASEALVQSALDKTGKGRTTLVIAHRLKTVRNCDRIIVLDRGNVIETGTHDELMKAKGLYFSLVLSQMVDIDDVEESGLDSDLESQRLQDLLSSSKTKKVSIVTEELDLSNFRDKSKAKSPILLRILKLNKHEWLQLFIGACAALGLGFTIPCYALLFGEIMGVLSETDPEKARKNVNMYAVLFLVIAVWAGICVFLQIYMFSIAGESLTMKLRYMTLVAMLQQEISWFDNPENTVGALCTRLSLDASNVQGATGVGFGILFQAFGSLGISFIVALVLQWKQALVSSVVIPFICLATFLEAKFISLDILKEMKREEYSANIAIEAVSNIKTIASLGVEDYFYKRYKDSLKKAHKKCSKQHIRGLLFGFAVAMESWSYALSLWYGGYLIKEDDVDYEDVFKVGELIIFGALMVGQSIAFAPNYSKGLVSAARIFNILDRKPKIDFNRESKNTPDLNNSKIEFQHIKFSYPTRPSRVLRDFSCEIKHGQTVALIGSSGCGKSTCIQLLERFYDVNDGAVLYANHNVKDLNLEWLRSQLGLVPQEPVLFATTITNNIAFGDNGRVVDMQEIVEAAKKANIHDFISNLPKGYNTELGRKGTQLSGGQKQRIAIARALLRNPKVLLLDEATSALDAENEKVVQAALDVAMVDRTCIVIAHRLLSIQDADKIIVVHSGQVVEEGTHQQLMAKKGVYYQMILISSAM